MDIYDQFLASDEPWETFLETPEVSPQPTPGAYTPSPTYAAPAAPEIPEVSPTLPPTVPQVSPTYTTPEVSPPSPEGADPLDIFLQGDMPWEDFQQESVYAELGLPFIDFKFGKPSEEYTEEMTAKRLGKQALISAGQGVADIARFAKGLEERKKLDDPMPFPNHTGWEKEPLDPLAVMTYDQRQFGSILRDVAEKEGAKPPPERIDKEWKKYLGEKQTASVKGAQDFIDAFPELMEGSSGLTEDALTGMARFLPTMGVTAVNPIAGTAMTFAQIAGSSYDEYRERGVDPEKAFNVAVINSLAQTPLEMAGNLLQIRALKNVAKSLGASFKMGDKLQSFAGALLAGALGEGSEEFLQQYPEEISNYYLANPDLSGKELAALVWEKKGEIAAKGKKAMVVGGYGGLMLAGTFRAAGVPYDVKSYISEKQQKINEEKGVPPAPPEEGAPPVTGEPPVAPEGAPSIDDIRTKYEAGEFTDEDVDAFKEIWSDDAEFVAAIDKVVKPAPSPKKAPVVKAAPEAEMKAWLLAKLKKDRPEIEDLEAAKIVDDTIARTEEFMPIEDEADPAEFSVALAKEEGKVLPGSAAVKIGGKVYGPAQTHMQVIANIPNLEELLGTLPVKSKGAAVNYDNMVTDGFLTDKGVFVDRKKALTLVPPEIAKGKAGIVSEELVEFSIAPATTTDIKEELKLTQFKRKAPEDSYAIRKGRARVGHIVGESSEVYKTSNIIKDNPDLGLKVGDTYYRIANTRLEKEHRGKGIYQEKIQEIANKYDAGALVHKFEASTALQRALKKMPGVVETDRVILIPPVKAEAKKKAPSPIRAPVGDSHALPFEEGPPSKEKIATLKKWLSKHGDKYKNEYVTLYHGTGISVPVLKEGLKPTSATRRRSYQATSGYVYLAPTYERAKTFGDLANMGKSKVYAVQVPVNKLLADRDQLNNQRAVGVEVGNTVAESLVYGGSARVKGKIDLWQIEEVKPAKAKPAKPPAKPKEMVGTPESIERGFDQVKEALDVPAKAAPFAAPEPAKKRLRVVAKKAKRGPRKAQREVPRKKGEIRGAGQWVEVSETGRVFEAPSAVAKNAGEVASILRSIGRQAREVLYTVTVDKNSNILEIFEHSKGTKGSSSAHPVEVAGHILNIPKAAKVYFVHNHPSGDTVASPEDTGVDTIIRDVLSLREIESDGLVIGGNKWRYISQIPAAEETDIRPATGKEKLAVVETILKGTAIGKPINNSNDLRSLIADKYDNKEGVIFFNAKNHDLGFMPWPSGETIREATAQILAASEHLNASAIAINLTKPVTEQNRAAFIGAFRSAFSGLLTMHEVMERGKSWADTGLMLTSPPIQGLGFLKSEEVLFSTAVKDLAETKITGKEQQKDVKTTLRIIKGGKHEYIDKLPKGVLDEADPVRKEDAEAEAAAQIVALKADRFSEQTISTIAEAQAWLEANGFPLIAEIGETANLIDSLIENENFQKLNIFDQIRVAAQLERPLRKADYKPVVAIGGNRKTKGLLGTKGIGEMEQIGDSGIRIADTIAGCDHYCFSCYALKGTGIPGISHQHPILAKLTGRLYTGEVLRIGEKGDPSRNWAHTNEQVRNMLARARKAKQDVSADNVLFTTKLLNLDGFDPKINRHLQVSLDPLFPDHMIRTMENILRVKSAHPSVVIVARIRSFHSTNADLNGALQVAVDFANKYKIPVLETRMRFTRKSSFTLLELDKSKYKHVGNQKKMKSPALKEESKDYHLCDVKDKSCPSCKNCVKLVQSRKRIVPVQAKAIKAAGIDGISIAVSQKFDPVGLTKEGLVPEFRLRPVEKKGERTPAEKVSDVITPILKTWTNFPAVNVVTNVSELPRRLRGQAVAQERKTKGKVEGLYDPQTDQVYLVASNLSEGRIEDVLRHEAEGHRGLRLMMGSDLNSFLDKVAAAKKTELLAMAPGLNFKDKAAVRNVANEWAARQIEAGTMKPLWHGRLVYAFKQWLRKLFPGLKMSDADIKIALHDTVMNVRRGRPQQVLNERQKATALASEKVVLWHRQMTTVLQDKLPGKGTPESYAQTINGFVRKGEFKEEELEWSGLREWLGEQKGKISKKDLLDYLTANNVRIEEVEKGGRHYREAGEIITRLENRGYDVQWDEDIETGQLFPTEIHHEKSGASVEFPLTEKDEKHLGGFPAEDLELIIELQDTTQTALRSDTKFGQHTLPGGRDYRELLLTMPGKVGVRFDIVSDKDIVVESFDTRREAGQYIMEAEGQSLSIEPVGTTLDADYLSPHWDEPNVLAHVRFDERTGPKGEKVLHIAEIQSDLHQEARGLRANRIKELAKQGMSQEEAEKITPADYGYQGKELPKGYEIVEDELDGRPLYFVVDKEGAQVDTQGGRTREEAVQSALKGLGQRGVPDVPFKKTWPLLTIKRMVRYAAEHGYTAVSWDTGAVQVDRYDLSKQIDSIQYRSDLVGTYEIEAIKDGHVVMEDSKLSDADLERLIGKDVTEKILEDTGEEIEADDGAIWMKLSGMDLKVGGEGMINFYDKLLPNVVNKFFNKAVWGKAKAGKAVLKVQDTAVFREPVNTKEEVFDMIAGDPMLVKDPENLESDESNLKPGLAIAQDQNGRWNLFEKDTGVAPVHTLSITPEMKTKAIHEGMPLFSVRKDLTPKQRALLEKHYPEKLAALDKKTGGNIIKESKEDSEVFAEMGEIPSNPEGFNMPHEGVGRQVFDLIQFKVQDRLNSLRRVQETIEKEKATEVPEAANAYQTEELYHGKVAERMGAFDSEHIDPLVETIHESEFELEDVEEYLYARHAEEANRQLEKINPKLKDNKALSGLSNEDAAEILSKYAGNKSMLDIAAQIDAITKRTRQVLVEEELSTAKEIEAWENTYDHYVPLKREGKSVGMPKKGQGVNITGPESKRRLTGSAERQAVNIVSNIIAQHEATVIRAEKAKVGRAMLKLAEAHPNKDLWEVDAKALKPHLKTRKSEEIDEETGLPQTLNEVVLGKDRFYKFNDNVLVIKVEGKERTITFNENNVHAQRIVRSLKNLGAADMNAFVKTLSTVNRWLAIVNTSANPEFIISNFARDIQTAGYNINDTQAKNMKVKVFKDVFKALKGIRRGIRGDFSSEWAKHYQDFLKAGAQTGWTDHYKNIEDREKNLKKKLNLMKSGSWRSVQRGAKGLLEFVSNENTAVENAIRLSVYTHLKAAGASDAVAASAAKNLTVNFNRRGDMGQTLNAFYLFFNANVQGSARLMYAAARSPKVRKMMYATVAFAVMLDIANRAIGGEDDDGENRYDKVPHWVKEHNLVLMRSNGDYFKIPLPWGYNTLHVLGQSIGEAVDPNADKFDALAAAGRLGSAVLGSFNPLGSESTLLQLAAPTIADPFVQMAENKNFAGIPIKPEQMPFDVAKPEYQLYFQSARKPSKWMAKMLSDLTGGDEVRPGLVDVSPEVFDLFIDTITGGAGKFMENTIKLPVELAKKDIEVRKVPGFKKIYGEAPDYYLRTKFYDNLSEIRYAQKSVDHYEDDKSKSASIKQKYGWEVRFIKRAKRDKKKIGDLRKKSKRIQQGGESEGIKAAKIEDIERQITQIMTDFNRTYKKKTGGTYVATPSPRTTRYAPVKPLTLREATQAK